MNKLHATLSRFGWELRPDLHDAGMTKHEAARTRGDLISRSMSEHFAVFAHPNLSGYIEVAGDNQFWWVPTLTSGESGPYGEMVGELEALLEQMGKPCDELAKELDDRELWGSLMAIGEIEKVKQDIRDALDSGTDLENFLAELLDVLEVRIGKADHTGRARTWNALYKAAEGPGAEPPPESPALRLHR
jgi:hypothetical protein